jgi:hypothetical protein
MRDVAAQREVIEAIVRDRVRTEHLLRCIVQGHVRKGEAPVCRYCETEMPATVGPAGTAASVV